MLSHIWTSEDTWPAAVCRDFIMEWSAVLDKRTQVTVALLPASLKTPSPFLVLV